MAVVEGGHIGGGENPGEPRVGEEHLPPPPAHGNHGEPAGAGTEDAGAVPPRLGPGALGSVPQARIHQGRHLPQSQAVAHRDGVEPHERPVALPHQVPFHRLPAQRVGTVQDHHFLAGGGAGFQRQGRRPLEGVDAAPDVLEIDQKDIQVLQHRGRGLPGLGVKAEDGDHQLGVVPVGGLHHVVLLLAAEAVLGAEEHGELPAVKPRRDLPCGNEIGGDRRRVHEEADPSPPEPLRAGARENLQSGLHARSGA